MQMIQGKMLDSIIEVDQSDWCLHWRGHVLREDGIHKFDEILQDLKE